MNVSWLFVCDGFLYIRVVFGVESVELMIRSNEV